MSPAERTVPNSAGTQPPARPTPPLACDCHMHIYDPARFPAARPDLRLQPDAVTGDYRMLQARLGTRRTVVVQPAAYVTDNRVTLDAIARLGLADTRGIAVVHPDVTNTALDEMAEGGIRGIRFSVFNPDTAAVRIGMIEPLAARMRERGWHVQLHMRGDQIADAAALLRRLPCRMVFDHIGRLPQPDGIAHPAFAVIRDLLAQGGAFVKLSGAYMDTAAGPPGYADAGDVARAFIAIAPERMLWGTDWPHPTEATKPDDAALLDLLGEWCGGDETLRRRILVDNPAALYGFD